MRRRWRRLKHILLQSSISSRGTRVQFDTAIVLVSVIPLLTAAFLLSGGSQHLPGYSIWPVAISLVVIVCLGYVLLLRYPRTILRLRRTMEHIARGELPKNVSLAQAEADTLAIEKYFNLIIVQMKNRIAIIEQQQEKVVEAERQKVMVESMCTACHHLGQPATTMLAYLTMLGSEPLSNEARHMVNECADAAEVMRKVLGKLQATTEYRTTAYCATADMDPAEALQIIEL